jgi:hypothetical protein
MRVALRETGSILVKAPADRVFEVLKASMQGEPQLRAEGERRIESSLSTFVLRDAPGGTQVIHARREDATLGAMRRPREELRAQVELELFRLQQQFS